MPAIPRDCALKLEVLRDFTAEVGGKAIKYVAGFEWLEFGPKIYTPRVEVKIVTLIKPTTILAH